MRTLSRQNLLDMLLGCAVLGTGGGGSHIKGMKILDKALQMEKTFTLVNLDELDADDLVATPYSCGAISPVSDSEKAKYARLPLLDEEPQIVALQKMERHLNKPIKAVIATELGGGNTATALYCAAMSGKCIVDGDPAGRSVPELQHTTYYLNGIDIQPISVVNRFGEAAIITDVVDDYRAEALVRALAVVSQNSIAVVDHVATARNLKGGIIERSLSYALKIGEAFRGAKEGGRNPAPAVADAGKGAVMFRGTIEANTWDTAEGFTVGELAIKGSGDYGADRLKVWYKNENLITWKNDRPFVTAPDLVCIVDDDMVEPLLNPFGDVGKHVTVVVLPAPKEWTTEKGLDILGPRSFGYDFDWKSFSVLLENER